MRQLTPIANLPQSPLHLKQLVAPRQIFDVNRNYRTIELSDYRNQVVIFSFRN